MKDESEAAEAILVGCVATKGPRPMPARDLFVSVLFRKRRRYAESTGVPWFIYSAKHGLVAPDQVIEPYDVSASGMSDAEKIELGESVASRLESVMGPLAGRSIEVHAGIAYVEALAPAMAQRGAQLIRPLLGLRIGEQLRWYDALDAPEAGRRDIRSGAVNLGPMVQIRDEQATGPFTFRWPADVENFERGWTFAAVLGGRSFSIRHGVTRRFVYGRERVRTVTWIGQAPVVEGVEADDYLDSVSLISLVRVAGGQAMARDASELPRGYDGFRIVRYNDEVGGRGSRAGLAVKLGEADLEAWARHAILRRLSRAQKLAPLAHEPARGPIVKSRSPTPGGVTAPVVTSSDVSAIVASLLEYGEEAAEDAGPTPWFTPDPEANQLVIDDAFAFLLAVILDQGIIAERAWAGPFELRRRLGHLDPVKMVGDPEAVAEAVRAPPALQRFINRAPTWLVDGARKVIRDYGGNAGRIWGDEPTADELQRRLDRFKGIGQKKAAMAVEILARDLKVPVRNLHRSDIAFDVHVRRVFLRTGLAQLDDMDHMVDAARAAYPDRPGALDYPTWLIGRSWCRPGVPQCPGCPLEDVCPKLIDAAANVKGA